MDSNQHPDSIWTFNKLHGKRATLWIPYLRNITRLKNHWYKVEYNGGDFQFDIRKIDALMLYGATGDMPVALLDDLAANQCLFMVHRRNMPHPYVLYPAISLSKDDLLTQQIISRENMATSAYIARTLIRERFKGFERFGLVVSATTYSNLAKCRSVKSVRQIEAQETKRFWSLYFDSLSIEIARRENHPVTTALDAVSFFMHGICLRWILAHKFSPAHGYLHEPTRYTALVYDVIEPYRYIIETAVKNTWLDSGETELVEKSINNAKELLEALVYCHETRQEVKRKSLLHGVVLALRSYLLNETARFVVPTEGKRIGGRRLKLAFRMPGPK